MLESAPQTLHRHALDHPEPFWMGLGPSLSLLDHETARAWLKTRRAMVSAVKRHKRLKKREAAEAGLFLERSARARGGGPAIAAA